MGEETTDRKLIARLTDAEWSAFKHAALDEGGLVVLITKLIREYLAAASSK